MKNIILFTTALIGFFTVGAYSQVTVQGSCTNVAVTGGIPNYAQDLYNGPWKTLQACAAVTNCPGCTMKHQMFLQRLNHSTGQFETITSAQYPPNNTFANLAHGTYRVKVKIPIPIIANNCISGFVNVYSTNGQYLGRRGWYPDNEEGEQQNVFYSNSAVVGNTVAADNSYMFIDVPETGSENTYDYGEVVKINTAASKNYNQWWVAIFENGGANRYNSIGWQFGTIPNNEVNLTDIWRTGNGNWNFEVNRSYTVQFVVENQQCLNGSGWNVNNRDFFICQPGSGCRIGEDSREIAITPNPASTSIRLQNFEPDLGREYRMLVADLSGKIVKSVELTDSEVDISSLPSGMFVVNVLRDGQRVHQSKLVVTQQ